MNESPTPSERTAAPAPPDERAGRAADGEIVCTECGHPRSDRRPPRPRTLVHWRRVLPVSLALLVAIAIGVASSGGAQQTGRNSGLRGGLPVPAPAVTAADLAALAGGAPAADGRRTPLVDLVESRVARMRPHSPLEVAIDVGLATPRAGMRWTWRRHGRPVEWIFEVEIEAVDEADARIPFTTDPAAPANDGIGLPMDHDHVVGTTPRVQWTRGQLMLKRPPEATGGMLRTTVVRPVGLAFPLVVAWCLLLASLASLAVVERLRGRWLEPRTRRFVVRGALFVAAIVCVLLLVPGRRESTTPGTVTSPEARLDVDPLAFVERARRDRPDAERELARTILEAVGVDPAAARDDDRMLAIAIEEQGFRRARGTIHGRPLPVLERTQPEWLVTSSRGTMDGTPVVPPAGLRVWITGGRLEVQRSDGDPGTPTARNSILLAEASVLLFAVLLAGTAPALAFRAVTRRRYRSGRCIACGHRVIADDPAAA